MPVYLGAWETLSNPPAERLGVPAYASLPAYIGVEEKDLIRMPRYAYANGADSADSAVSAVSAVSADGEGKAAAAAAAPAAPMATLSGALAAAYAAKHPDRMPHPPAWLRPLVREERPASPGGRPEPALLVNYGQLEDVEREDLLTVSPQSVAEFGERFRDRLVLLGRASRSQHEDLFPLPGRDGGIPGVFIHACAAETFVKDPLYELKPGVRALIDFLLSVAVFCLVALVRWRHRRERDGSGEPFGGESLPYVYLGRVALGVAVAGFLLVRWAHVMWLDFLVVAVALLLHRTAESGFEAVLGRVRAWLPHGAGGAAAHAAAPGAIQEGAAPRAGRRPKGRNG